MKDYRCPECGRLLFKSDTSSGTIQTYCKTCGALRIIHLDHKVMTPHTTR
jgi:DNA-directed RNA polymerase subunit RPC12/RpoP